MAAGGDVIDTRRSLVVDQEEFEEQFLRCPICREKFNQESHTPKSLPCNHTFCQECLIQVFHHHEEVSEDDDPWVDAYIEGILKCPTCRVEVYISRNEIANIPSDHRVIQMMDFLSRTTSKTQNICQKHERQPLNFFCKQCMVPICRDCTVLEHKETDGHVIVDVTDGLSDFTDDFNETERQTEVILGKLKNRTDSLANASKRLDLIELELRNKIKDTFIEYRLLLERRQIGLIKILKETITEQKKKINSCFMSVCMEGTALQKLHDTHKKSRGNNDIKQLFKAHQQIKDEQRKFDDMCNTADGELFVSCEFKNDSECIYLSEMNNLGELRVIKDETLKDSVPAHQLVLLEEEDRRTQFDDDVFAQLTFENDDDDNGRLPSNEVNDRVSSHDLVDRASMVESVERLAQRAATEVATLREARRRGGHQHRRERYRVVRHPLPHQRPSGNHGCM